VARREFRLPDLGEGLAEAEIVQWLVAAGESVTVNQPLVEVETAKAVVELPSPFAGRLVTVQGEAGDTITVGTVLVVVEDDTGADLAAGSDAPTRGRSQPATEPTSPAGQAPPPAVPAPTAAAAATAAAAPRNGREPVLVGYGPRATAAGTGPGRTRRRHRGVPAVPGAADQKHSGASNAVDPNAVGPIAVDRHAVAARTTGPRGGEPGPLATWAGAAAPPGAGHHGGKALAKPPVRRLARDLGVDLGGLAGTGPAGTISRHDVEAAAGILDHPEPPPAATEPTTTWPADAWPTQPMLGGPPSGLDGQPDALDQQAAARAAGAGQRARAAGQIPAGAVFDEASQTWRVRVSGVRRATAKAMVSSAFTAPHVTEFVSVDLTRTLAVRDRIAALPEFAGLRVTPLLFVARALLAAARRHPMINATWLDGGAGDPEIVISGAINLGIAVASPRGLLVPNIPDADRLDLAGLARALDDVTTRTRNGQARPADLTGGTITITNIGVFGVDIGTPILNPGEAAILAVGAIRPAPWVHEGELAVRTVGQLALSFDHRLVDGELGSAVLADVAAMLTDPTLLLAWS